MNKETLQHILISGGELPRKTKKAFLGKRKSKKDIREAIANLTFNDYGKMFCPECGCVEYFGVDEGNGHINYLCLKCNSWLGLSKDGDYRHVLEDY